MIRESELVNRAAVRQRRMVVQAEMALIEAMEYLRTLQEKALRYGGYDPEAYDAAILASREARAWAVLVRTAWQHWQARHLQAAA